MTTKKPGLWDYVKAAFSARPIGMLVPPNWIGLAAFGVLGLVSPGFLLLGVGLELGYLYTLASNERFRRFVKAEGLQESRKEWEAKQRGLVRALDPQDRSRYRSLERRCQSVLEAQQWSGSEAGVQLRTQGEGLGRLLWIFLRLLMARESIRRVLPETDPEDDVEPLADRIDALEERLADEGLGADLRKSLTGQLDILKQRREKRVEARAKMDYLAAELTRIEEQVELIREQALVAASPEVVSRRIDAISATLGGTTQWIEEQKALVGEVEDLLVEPQPVTVPKRPEPPPLEERE